MSNILRECVLSYLSFLKDGHQNSEQQAYLVNFLRDEYNYVCELASPATVAINATPDELLPLAALVELCSSFKVVKADPLFIRFEETISSMGYFHGHLNKDKLGKYIDCVAYFGANIRNKKLPEAEFQQALVTLIETERKSSGCNLPMDQVLLSSTIWDDLNVALLKPARQVTVDNTTSARDRKLAMIKELLDTKAKHGPNVKYTFALFSVSFASIVLVAMSTTVRESPYLFRVLWALAYAINAVTVSIPGRLDRMFKDGDHVKPWHTLFEPATWSFSIWALIYFSELALTLYVLIAGIPPDLFQMMVPYWLAGNWFQALWCFAFRPEFKRALWVPMGCLGCASVTFGIAHYRCTLYMQEMHLLPKCAMMLFRFPLALHTAWLACATLLTLNSWLSVSQAKRVVQIIAAFSSAFFAAFLGIACMYYTQDAIIGLTFAWALDGLACRALECSYVPQELASQDIYETLSSTESWLSNLLKFLCLLVVAGPTVFLPLLGAAKPLIRK